MVVGSALLGLIAGFAWQHIAPRAVFVMVSRGTADVLNPETRAFIAADGWFCVVSLIGGGVSGLLGYLLAVRRFGPLPMLGVLGGGLAAAYIAQWVGQQAGRSGFEAMLATARVGTVLHAPLNLGAGGALAFWPLAAGVVAGCIVAGALVRERRRRAAAGIGSVLASAGYPAQPSDSGSGDGAGPRTPSGLDRSARPARSSRPGHSSWPAPGQGTWPAQPGGPAPGSWPASSTWSQQASWRPPPGAGGPDVAPGEPPR